MLVVLIIAASATTVNSFTCVFLDEAITTGIIVWPSKVLPEKMLYAIGKPSSGNHQGD